MHKDGTCTFALVPERMQLIKAVTTFPQQLVQESNAHQPYETQCLYTGTTGRNLYIELEF